MDKDFKELDAVHENDLDRLLARVGILDNFHANSLKCKFCKVIVTSENIYSLIKDSGHFKLVCEKAECVSQLMQFLNTRKKPI